MPEKTTTIMVGQGIKFERIRRITGCPTIRDKSIHISVEPDSESALVKAITKTLKTLGINNPVVNQSDFTKKDFQELRNSFINT